MGIFAASLFTSAWLLFSVQPMIARMLLPLLGGSPQVWNGCMLFFQALLLAGYGSAHLMARRLPFTAQVMIVILLAGFGISTLPFSLPPDLLGDVPREADPAPWLFRALARTVGAPCLLLALCPPLLQAWFAATSHRRAVDAYFLYQASNLGSLGALAGYVALIEPRLTIPEQTSMWRAGYLTLAALLVGCALVKSRFPGAHAPAEGAGGEGDSRGGPAAEWLALAFLPSSLMLGVTTHLSTDVATHPLLWVCPFILYLLAFILSFETRLDAERWTRPFAGVLVLWAATMALEATQPVWILLHLLTFFLASYLCLARLSARRPPSCELTRFYLHLAAGGVAGGIFNALVAPRVFDRPLEYPLVMIITAALIPEPAVETGGKRRPGLLLAFIAVGAAAAGAILASGGDQVELTARLSLALPLSFCFLLRHHPRHFAAGLLAVLALPALVRGQGPSLVLRHRNFFGVSTVTREAARGVLQLEHGVTVHGRQSLDPARARTPLTYYHPSGPAGDIFQMVAIRHEFSRIAVVGLGIGSLASYATPAQEWTFFEIDPFIVRLARDLGHFTYLATSRAQRISVEVGDARLRLASMPPASFDLLALDAFSSDAIPMHLLTREALGLYLSRVREGGIVTLHVSNQYLDLRPVVARLAREAGVEAVVREHAEIGDELEAASVAPSTWVVVTKDPSAIATLVGTGRWEPLVAPPEAPLWTDDQASLLPLLRWY